MHAKQLTVRCLAVVVSLTFAPAYNAAATEPNAQVENTVGSKSCIVQRMAFPNRGEVRNVSLWTSTDGEKYEFADTDPDRTGEFLGSIAYSEEKTIVLTPLAAHWGVGKERFLFEHPGECRLRWQVAFKDDETEPLTIERSVTVLPAGEPDRAFIERVSESDFLADLLGSDPLANLPDERRRTWAASPAGADWRALLVVGEILEATRAREPGAIVGQCGGFEPALRWADSLAALAQEFPESSYAPYAAYFAGCCYSGLCLGDARNVLRDERKQGERRDDLEEGTRRAELIMQSDKSARAFRAFELAAEHADDYLKPRALYQHGYLRMIALDFEAAQRLLSAAKVAAPGQGTVQGLIDEAREGIPVVRERFENAERQKVRASSP